MIRIRPLPALAALVLAGSLVLGGVPGPALAAAVRLTPGIAPTPAAEITADDVASMLLARINGGRQNRGLVVYRAWGTLADLAQERAQRMADAGTLSHDIAGGNVGAALDTRGADWFGYGEAIGMTGWPWGQDAADSLYSMWTSSDPHRALLFSADYNYIGVGVAQAADGSTWVSAVMTESRDHTAPVARTRSLTRSGRTLVLTWAGSDRQLQTHTAGLRSFDVQLRRDDRAWRTIRDDTTATRLKLRHRVRGHAYYFRVQSADRRGTLSAWTKEVRIWVP